MQDEGREPRTVRFNFLQHRTPNCLTWITVARNRTTAHRDSSTVWRRQVQTAHPPPKISQRSVSTLPPSLDFFNSCCISPSMNL